MTISLDGEGEGLKHRVTNSLLIHSAAASVHFVIEA